MFERARPLPSLADEHGGVARSISVSLPDDAGAFGCPGKVVDVDAADELESGCRSSAIVFAATFPIGGFLATISILSRMLMKPEPDILPNPHPCSTGTCRVPNLKPFFRWVRKFKRKFCCRTGHLI